MALAKYHAKRQFNHTPEPKGKTRRGGGPLRFVVQKHHARHLHYDFRLELDGTLKSWAVPKGPSLDPKDKRLAMMVEDHPLDYHRFEGTIPEGNYGAGTVMVWDEGTYCARQTADRSASERLLREGLRKGHLSFVLHGEKLKGEFALVRLTRGEKNAWLLLKKDDAWASETDVREEDRSVTTDRTLDEIARKAKPARTRRKGRRSLARKDKVPVAIPRDAPKAAMPRQVKPMLATLVEEPFDRAGWLFEIKWDGYRAVAEVSPEGVSLYSRNHKSFEHKFTPIVESLRGLAHEAVLDGEVVVIDEQGRSDFQLLQNYQTTGVGRLRYYVFDLLYLDGRDLRGLPLGERKALLGKVIAGLPDVLLSEHVEEHGAAFFQAAAAQGLEGIIAKNGSSPYREGERCLDWLKLKMHQRQEAVIGGFTEPRGSRKDLGALLLGVYVGTELTYIGHTGGGLNTRGLSELRTRLEPLVQKACPFRVRPAANAPVHWVQPELVCEVKFQEWTQDGIMRQPIFLGLREDKPARAVRREEARPLADTAPAQRQRRTGRVRPLPMAAAERSVRALSRSAHGMVHEPALTNLEKVYWPEEGYTKGELIAYYREVASVLLPYLKDRPQSLHRHPNGIAGKSFFQKDVRKQPPPDWVETVVIPPDSGQKPLTYLLCQNEATLLYLANLGCIEINPWNARVGTLEHPDYLILDLDPEDAPFANVIDAAVTIRKLLERAGAPSLCKTSGKRGLHVVVPLGAHYDCDQARQFAELIATLVHQERPETTSLVRSPALRQGKVYLDFLQNRRGQTLVAPYSVRPYPGATVSTPLYWREVKKGLHPSAFTIKTMPRRLNKVGDLWEPVLGRGIDLQSCLERLAGS